MDTISFNNLKEQVINIKTAKELDSQKSSRYSDKNRAKNDLESECCENKNTNTLNIYDNFFFPNHKMKGISKNNSCCASINNSIEDKNDDFSRPIAVKNRKERRKSRLQIYNELTADGYPILDDRRLRSKSVNNILVDLEEKTEIPKIEKSIQINS